jgi:hypothetical protein
MKIDIGSRVESGYIRGRISDGGDRVDVDWYDVGRVAFRAGSRERFSSISLGYLAVKDRMTIFGSFGNTTSYSHMKRGNCWGEGVKISLFL